MGYRRLKGTGFKPPLASGETWLHDLQASPERSFRASSQFSAAGSNPAGYRAIRYARPQACPRAATCTPSTPTSSPTREAWGLGKKMAVAMLAQFAKDHAKAPEESQYGAVVWRDHTAPGAMESESPLPDGRRTAMEPRGVVDGLRLIPERNSAGHAWTVVLTLGGILPGTDSR